MHRLSSALYISYYVLGIHEFTILSGLDIFSGTHLIQHNWKWNFFKKIGLEERSVSWKDNFWSAIAFFHLFYYRGGWWEVSTALHLMSLQVLQESFSAIFLVACWKRATIHYLRGSNIWRYTQSFCIFVV